MPSQDNMSPDDTLYRAVLEYQFQRHEWQIDANNGRSVRVPVGPVERAQKIIGPYTNVRPIKAWVTRNRSHYTNLTIVRIEKVTGWEEVDI